MRVRVEGGLAVPGVAGPPPDGDLLGVHRVAHDEVAGRRVGGRAGEQVHREVERAPPCVHRGRAATGTARGTPRGRARPASPPRSTSRPAQGRTSRARSPRRTGRSTELPAGSSRPRRPPPACAPRRAARASPRPPIGRGPARSAPTGRRCARPRPRARAGPAPRRTRRTRRAPAGRRLPPARGEPQRRVLQLRLGRRQRHAELAEHLRVRVQRVARGGPVVVGEGRPGVRHARTLSRRLDRAAHRVAAGRRREAVNDDGLAVCAPAMAVGAHAELLGDPGRRGVAGLDQGGRGT